MTKPVTPPLCPYCHKPAVLVEGDVIYPHRTDLAHKRFWYCQKDNAWVGCHMPNTIPMGRLANAELRSAKMAAHDAFDPFWDAYCRKHGVSKGKGRGKAYKWLAEQLGIRPADCHIGMFDVDTCRRTVEICNNFRKVKTA
jgi:hypothetical protein